MFTVDDIRIADTSSSCGLSLPHSANRGIMDEKALNYRNKKTAVLRRSTAVKERY